MSTRLFPATQGATSMHGRIVAPGSRAIGIALMLGLATGGGAAVAQGMQTTQPAPAAVYSPPSTVTGETNMQRAPSPVRVVPNPGAASTQTTPRAPAITPQRAAPSPGMRAVEPIQPTRPVTPPRYTPPPTRQYR
ncbi:hypothetical protein [Schauerella aestuarii]|uniref:hypothetical protein n=1 Tax=Schauerella aestuarii TaxID=2511204 RepID=UPI00136BCE9A|nr:hypothetical protein [Achromobacter aestuarii]MYZ44811.1 hypothetical protein [Achromobacter aestuarii]